MRAIAWLLMVLVCLLAGCGEARLDPRATLYIEPGTPDGVVAAILDAAEEWSQATHGRVALDVRIGEAPTGAARIRVHAPVHPEASADARLQDPITIDVGPDLVPVAADETTQPLVRAIIDHELGHGFMGPEHHSPGLMQPSGGFCIDRGTLERFCAGWGCPRGFEPSCG